MARETEEFLTLMFVDVPNIAKIRETGGEEAAGNVVAEVSSLLDPIREKHDGELVRRIGSTLLCTFADVDQAVSAASEMQKAMVAAHIEAPVAPTLRMALNTGKVRLRNGRPAGETVTLAARMVTLIQPRQVAVTERVCEELSNKWSETLRDLPEAEKIEQRLGVSLSEVVWRESDGEESDAESEIAVSAGAEMDESVGPGDGSIPPLPSGIQQDQDESGASSFAGESMNKDLTSPLRTVPDTGKVKRKLQFAPAPSDIILPKAAKRRLKQNPLIHRKGEAAADGEEKPSGKKGIILREVKKEPDQQPEEEEQQPSSLCLIWGEQKIIVDSRRKTISIGRQADCDIVVSVDTASRKHADVCFRDDGFFLVDHSWNGTFLYDEEGFESVLQNSESKLGTSGVICPGCPGEFEGAAPIRFIAGE